MEVTLMRLACAGCRRELDESSETVWYETIGWIKSRSGGGANQISLGRTTGKVMCSSCMKKEKS